MSQLPSDEITAAPHLCVINETLRNPISFEIPSTGALLSPDSPLHATRAGGKVMKQEGMFHVLSINLYPALRHYWISRNFAKWDESVRKVPSSLFSSSLILLDISSGIQRIPSWTLDGENLGRKTRSLTQKHSSSYILRYVLCVWLQTFLPQFFSSNVPEWQRSLVKATCSKLEGDEKKRFMNVNAVGKRTFVREDRP